MAIDSRLKRGSIALVLPNPTGASDADIRRVPAWVYGSAFDDVDAPTITGSNVNSTSNLITSSFVQGVLSYKYYRAATQTGSYSLVGTVEDGFTFTDTGLTAQTTYWYKGIVTTNNGSSAFSTPISVTTSSTLGTPIEERIESAMVDVIDNMVTGSDYYYSWGTVNQEDEARITAWPTAYVELLTGEENEDSDGGNNAGVYQNTIQFKITSWYKNTDPSQIIDNPKENVKSVLSEMLHDLKKGFGIDYSLGNSGAHFISYDGNEREFLGSGDIPIAGKLITNWSVRYSQDRQTPTQAGC